MNTQDRIELLDNAQYRLAEAIGYIKDALKGTEHERHAEYYIIGHLRSWLNSDGYGFNMGIQQYIDALFNEEKENK